MITTLYESRLSGFCSTVGISSEGMDEEQMLLKCKEMQIIPPEKDPDGDTLIGGLEPLTGKGPGEEAKGEEEIDEGTEGLEESASEPTIEELKALCDKKGIKYHHWAGVEKLKELLTK